MEDDGPDDDDEFEIASGEVPDDLPSDIAEELFDTLPVDEADLPRPREVDPEY